jgi:hypothetical protein
MSTILLFGFASALRLLAPGDSVWILDSSTLTYHVSHPLHESEGVTHAARGKGACHAGQCDFLIAVPLKSFESGDSNRDLHMLQVTKAGQFPLVTVRTSLPESAETGGSIRADLEIEFAGRKVSYKQVPFEESIHDGRARITGTIPATLDAFKIEPPSLFAIPVKNDIPVTVDMEWRPGP